MVFDSLDNAQLYYGMGVNIKAALEFFKTYDASLHEAKPLTIDNGITVNRAAFTTAEADAPQLEAHRQFIDVMYVAEGEEALYFQPLNDVPQLSSEYDPAIDACLAPLDKNSASRFHFHSGMFAIFFPDDAHCPSQLFDKPSSVKKLIAKVPIE